MINAINVPQQIVQPNLNLLFAQNRIKTGCGVRHDAGSGLFNINKGGLYRVHFNGNVLATAAQELAQLAIKLDGEPVLSAVGKVTLTAIGDYADLSIDTIVSVPCNCCVTITIGNVGTAATTVENANIIIERVG